MTSTTVFEKSKNIAYSPSNYDSLDVPSSRNTTIIKPNDFVCPRSASNPRTLKEQKETTFKINHREILVIQSTLDKQPKFFENINKIFSYSRIKFTKTSKTVDFTALKAPLIIFESYIDFLEYQESEEFKKYVEKNKIGLLIFNKNKESDQEVEFNECQLNDDEFQENFLYMTKLNTQKFQVKKTMKYNKEFKNLFYEKETLKTILKCEQNNNIEEILFVNTINEIKYAFISIELIDDIWLLKSLFLDSIRYLTNGAIDIGLKRYVQIDIDDIFVSKMVPEDLYELIKLQNELSEYNFNNNQHKFKFVFGLSGKLYQNRNSSAENEGDRLILGDIYIP